MVLLLLFGIYDHMELVICRNSIASQFIDIKLNLNCKTKEHVRLQLPTWRPGRYELANYSQKIRSFSVYNGNEVIEWKKSTKDCWEFEANSAGCYTVSYEYYCNQMDAGGSWSDDQQIYLNFSNFSFELMGRETEHIWLSIEIPQNYAVATALTARGRNRWEADNFQHLMDSPLLATENLQHTGYSIKETDFHLWFSGEIHFDIDYVADIFKKFTERQIEDFGDFPARNYYFIFQLLPYKHYHGVEHAFSTVITFGPANSLSEKSQVNELVGVSSHELYHFWNVCRIRPKELIPYDLSKEVYLDCGLVMEGVTSYFGDIYLLRSGYFKLEEYLQILTTQIQKEFDSFGWKNQSIVEASFDLWLDGYKPGIPHKKVSIYNRGALISLCLDLMLFDHGSTLAIVMQQMWEMFGKSRIGYSLSDFEDLVNNAANGDKEVIGFLQQIVHDREDLLPYLERQLSSIGIALQKSPSTNLLLSDFGIRLNDAKEVISVHPDSEAYLIVMLKDTVESVEGLDNSAEEEGRISEINLKIRRWGRTLTVKLKPGKTRYFPVFDLKVVDKPVKLVAWSR